MDIHFCGSPHTTESCFCNELLITMSNNETNPGSITNAMQNNKFICSDPSSFSEFDVHSNEKATDKDNCMVKQLLEPGDKGKMSNLEQEGRHLPYLTHEGGCYIAHDFNDTTMTMTMLCGLARIKSVHNHHSWGPLSALSGYPDLFVERCQGGLTIVANKAKNNDTVNEVGHHICGYQSIISANNEDDKNNTGKEIHPYSDTMAVIATKVIDRKRSVGEDMLEGNNNCLSINNKRRINKNGDGIFQYQPDNRPPLCIFSNNPETPWMKTSDIESLKLMIESDGQKDLWDNLIGGRDGSSRKRKFTPNLKSFKEIHDLVERCMGSYILWVQQQYPALKYYKLAILKSYPGAQSQYDGCNKRLHSDYPENVNKRPPNERPVSLLVALDEFDFMYLKDRNNCRGDIITQPIYPQQAVMFTNYCLHAGGRCTSAKVCYRLFAYMVSNVADIPQGTVQYYYWESMNSNPKDDVIRDMINKASGGNGDMRQKDDKQHSSRGRVMVRTDFYSPGNANK